MGKVYRREEKEDAPWTVVYHAKDTQALALAVLANGHVVIGTGPSGLRARDRLAAVLKDLSPSAGKQDAKGEKLNNTGE